MSNPKSIEPSLKPYFSKIDVFSSTNLLFESHSLSSFKPSLLLIYPTNPDVKDSTYFKSVILHPLCNYQNHLQSINELENVEMILFEFSECGLNSLLQNNLGFGIRQCDNLCKAIDRTGLQFLPLLLQEQKTTSEKLAFAQRFLKDLFPKETSFDFTVFKGMMELIENSAAMIKVADLAKKTGYTERHLRRITIKYTGMSPKDLVTQIKVYRIIQFIHQEVIQRQAVRWNKVISNFGYYNSGQLKRDFLKITGIAPQDLNLTMSESSVLSKAS